jgi:preprotein translocase subunit YajC
MGRLATFILTLVCLHFIAAIPVYGQENVANEQQTELSGPGLRAAEPADSTSESSGLKLVETRENTPAGGNAKKSKGFFEEFFANPLNYLLIFVVCFYIYMLFWAPKAGRKDEKAQIERLKNLKKNDRVVTSSGIHGIVANINNEAGTITLRVDENSNAKLTVDRIAIRSIQSQ